MASAANCIAPYRNYPICDLTNAEYWGSGYVAMHAIYVILAVTLFIVALVQTVRLVRIKGLRPIDLQRFLHYCMLWNAFGFIIRSIDPQGWQGKMPYRFESFLEETNTSLCYIVLLGIVFSWVKLIYVINGKDKDQSKRKRLRKIKQWIQLPFICLIFFCGQMQYSPGPSYVWRNIKFLIEIIFNMVFFSVGWKHGYVIFSTLASMRGSGFTVKDHRTPSGNTAPSPVVSSGSTNSKDEQGKEMSHSSHPSQEKRPVLIREGSGPVDSALARSTTSSPPPAVTVTQQSSNNASKRQALQTLILLFSVMSIISIAVIVTQFIAIADGFNTRVDYLTRPADPPTSMLGELEFDILQYIAAAFLLFFFRKMQEKPKFQESSRSEREAKPNRPAKDRGSVRNVTFTGPNPGLQAGPTSPSTGPTTTPQNPESPPPSTNAPIDNVV